MAVWKYDGTLYHRRPTRTVHVGSIAVGSQHPIRVQSMTTPSTQDTAATVEQIVRLVDAGCEIVRLTVPTTADADNLPNIREQLAQRGIRVPLVADIHFTPRAAERAVEHVDKIRINPGNYADKKRFAVREYTDHEYEAELARIEKIFLPLVRRAKELGVAMRIGTNHGSLSDRIMNRYGDTPEGMVESALEFVRICEAHGYHELILSMKASNPVVVLQVYRLLATRMAEQGMDYPFHLGVTEAGDGEDGRIKSAVGIGALLDDGIGDTVRVSLTEDPVHEIPVARALADRYNQRQAERGADAHVPAIEPAAWRDRLPDPYSYQRRETRELAVGPHKVGGKNPVLVEVALASRLSDTGGIRKELDSQAGVRVPEETRAELVAVEVARADELELLEGLRDSVRQVAPRLALSATVRLDWLRTTDESTLRRWATACDRLHIGVTDPLDDATRSMIGQLVELAGAAGSAILLELSSSTADMNGAVQLAVDLARSGPTDNLLFALAPSPAYSPLHAVRMLVARLDQAGLNLPLLLLDRPAERDVDPILAPSAALGGLLCGGIGDAIQVAGNSASDSRRLAFNILQAARVRITKTEFISCPSCGRTLFDLEETTARIKERTAHLKGVKIAIMGCVVNGPGEMADADFGYVGWGDDKIALFVGKEMVARDVPTAEADRRLVDLIKQHGMWVDPPVPA